MALSRKRPACSHGAGQKKAKCERDHNFHIFLAGVQKRPCRSCKKALNGLCVKHGDPDERGRVKEAMKKLAESREAYLQTREEEYARLSPGERYWYDYAFYRNGGPYAELAEDSSDSEANNRHEKQADEEEDDLDDWRDYSIYYHLGCFAKCKHGVRSKVLVEPSLAVDIPSDDRERVAEVWAAMKSGTAVQLLPEERGHLTKKQFSKIMAVREELKKKKVQDLRDALARNSQGLLNGKPKSILLEAVAELKVLGALPKCPVCHGGRNGKGGNLSWNRETDSFTCTGYFSRLGPQACRGPGPKHEIQRKTWVE